MKKAKVKEIEISDRLYIKKQDVEDHDELIALFTYDNGEEFLSTISESETHYIVPANGYYKLEWESVVDNRTFEITDTDLSFSGTLRPEQNDVVDQFFSRGRARSGILQAPCGWGKTFTGCDIISRNKTKTLIMVHTKLLFRQWIEELEKQIPTAKIGKVGDGILDIQDVTVGIYKSVYNNIDSLKNNFSMVLVDEAHLCPAEMFSTALNGINAKIKIGISATPRRKDGKHVFLSDYFSTFMVHAKDPRQHDNPSVHIRRTDVRFNVIDPQRDWSRQLNKLCSNKNYIKLIAKVAKEHIKAGRCPLILGERVQMLKDLQLLIPDSVCLIGETDESTRTDVLSNVGGKYKAVLSTKLFDEGISCHRLDTLYITCPNNNPIKMEQRIGRIIREHNDAKIPLVEDFWLTGGVVARQQQKRLEWYKQRGYDIL
jgi:superfamily II DNA or RNA helicase|tara:strand:+ start:1772 stop:3058 length:1287 start_codon:yes stop_codon:yes gene_type:complete